MATKEERIEALAQEMKKLAEMALFGCGVDMGNLWLLLAYREPRPWLASRAWERVYNEAHGEPIERFQAVARYRLEQEGEPLLFSGEMQIAVDDGSLTVSVDD